MTLLTTNISCMILEFWRLNILDDIVPAQIHPCDRGTQQTGKQLWKGSVSNARRLAPAALQD